MKSQIAKVQTNKILTIAKSSFAWMPNSRSVLGAALAFLVNAALLYALAGGKAEIPDARGSEAVSHGERPVTYITFPHAQPRGEKKQQLHGNHKQANRDMQPLKHGAAGGRGTTERRPQQSSGVDGVETYYAPADLSQGPELIGELFQDELINLPPPAGEVVDVTLYINAEGQVVEVVFSEENQSAEHLSALEPIAIQLRLATFRPGLLHNRAVSSKRKFQITLAPASFELY